MTRLLSALRVLSADTVPRAPCEDGGIPGPPYRSISPRDYWKGGLLWPLCEQVWVALACFQPLTSALSAQSDQPAAFNASGRLWCPCLKPGVQPALPLDTGSRAGHPSRIPASCPPVAAPVSVISIVSDHFHETQFYCFAVTGPHVSATLVRMAARSAYPGRWWNSC